MFLTGTCGSLGSGESGKELRDYNCQSTAATTKASGWRTNSWVSEPASHGRERQENQVLEEKQSSGAPPPHRPRGSRTARAAPAPRDPPARPASPMLTIAELRTSSGLTRLQPPGVQRAEQRERAVTMALPGRKMAGEELPLCSPGLQRPDSGFDGREKTRSGTVLGLH